MGLWGQCCVRAALYRGQNCRTCPGVVQLPVLCPCCLVQGASLQNMLSGLWACLAWVCVTDHGNTCGHAKWWSAGSTAGVEDLQLTIRKVYLYCWGTCTQQRGQKWIKTLSQTVKLTLLWETCTLNGVDGNEPKKPQLSQTVKLIMLWETSSPSRVDGNESNTLNQTVKLTLLLGNLHPKWSGQKLIKKHSIKQ